jgi:hypothetical protein
MTRIALISSVVLLCLISMFAFAQDDVLMLDDAMIEGEVREPSVAMFSSRIVPEINAFKLEKSFLENVGITAPEIITLSGQTGKEVRISDADSLISRPRILKSTSTHSDNHVSQNGSFNESE